MTPSDATASRSAGPRGGGVGGPQRLAAAGECGRTGEEHLRGRPRPRVADDRDRGGRLQRPGADGQPPATPWATSRTAPRLLGPILSWTPRRSGRAVRARRSSGRTCIDRTAYKTQGDRSSRTCQGGEDGCTGTVNDEFDPQGYFPRGAHRRGRGGSAGDAPALRPGLRRHRQPMPTTAPSGTGAATTSTRTRPSTPSRATPARPPAAPPTSSQVGATTPTAGPGRRGDVPTITCPRCVPRPPSLQPKTAPAITGCTSGSTRASGRPDHLQHAAVRELVLQREAAAVFHQWGAAVHLHAHRGRRPLPAGAHRCAALRHDGRHHRRLPGATPAVTGQTGDDPEVTGNGSNRSSCVVSTAASAISVSGVAATHPLRQRERRDHGVQPGAGIPASAACWTSRSSTPATRRPTAPCRS